MNRAVAVLLLLAVAEACAPASTRAPGDDAGDGPSEASDSGVRADGGGRVDAGTPGADGGTSMDGGSPPSRFFDEDCDGLVDECRVETLRPDGLRTTDKTDDTCDGVFESCTSFTYDGGAFSRTRDDGCDGTPDSCAGGTQVNGVTTSEWYDSACDGPPYSSCSASTLDDAGRIAHTTVDDGCDGSIEWCESVLRRDGGVVETASDYACDLIVESCRGKQYDALGREIASWSLDGTCADPHDSNCSTRAYDGGTYRETKDLNCDGALIAIECVAETL